MHCNGRSIKEVFVTYLHRMDGKRNSWEHACTFYYKHFSMIRNALNWSWQLVNVNVCKISGGNQPRHVVSFIVRFIISPWVINRVGPVNHWTEGITCFPSVLNWDWRAMGVVGLGMTHVMSKVEISTDPKLKSVIKVVLKAPSCKQSVFEPWSLWEKFYTSFSVHGVACLFCIINAEAWSEL